MQSIEQLRHQLQRGDLSAWRGAVLNATLPLPQAVLNEALAEAVARKGGPLRALALEFHAPDRIGVSLSVQKWGLSKTFTFEMLAERDLGFPHAPKLRLSLPGSHALIGTLLEILSAAFSLPGGIAVSGGTIEVDLAQVTPPEAAPWLRVVKRAGVWCEEGRLILGLNLEVD